MNVKLVVKRGGKRQAFRLSPPIAIIGRARGSAVRIPSAEVSRQHCKLKLSDGVVLVEDLGSRNGTFVNGKRIAGQQSVRPGDELDVGPVRFTVEYDIAPSKLAKLEPDDEPEMEPLGDVLAGLADGSVVGSADELEPVDDLELVLDGKVADEEEDDLLVIDPKEYARESEQTEPAPVARPDFTFNQPWQMPEAGEMRDILSQIEDNDKPPPRRPPPPPSPRKKK